MKGATYRRDISSRRWMKLRWQQLSDHPLCERCERNGLVVSACEVHHIKPVESVPSEVEQRQLMFSLDNLMSVCHACHVALHRELGSHSRAVVSERARTEAEAAIARLFE